MVTMNSSEKASQKVCQTASGSSREQDKSSAVRDTAANSAAVASIPQPDESPNYLVYRKMEAIIESMQDENSGVPVRTVKSFMTKIPSVFTGYELVAWLMRRLNLEDTGEALHMAHLLASHGYLFPIDDHCLTVKNDNTYYRFQTPYFWPSNQWEPENTDYAVYLCKRTMQNKARLELADYEAESLARLQKMFSRKWEFIFMQAEAQSKVDKKRDKLERKVLDSQERAFWDVHRPMPGCVNTTELDMRKVSRVATLRSARIRAARVHTDTNTNTPKIVGNPIVTITNPQEIEEEIQKSSIEAKKDDEAPASATNGMSQMPHSSGSAEGTAATPTGASREIEDARRQVNFLKQRIERRKVKVSKVSEMTINYYEQYTEYDAFLTPPEWPNPWLADTPELWEQDKQCKEWVALRRARRWAFGLKELLQDPPGRQHFAKFLQKEFSGENLKFWLAVQDLKALPIRCVPDRAKEIWEEFLGCQATTPLNIDAATREATRAKIDAETADRYCFDIAQTKEIPTSGYGSLIIQLCDIYLTNLSTCERTCCVIQARWQAHVFHLMKSDSYSRYLRCDMYKDYLNGSKKKTSVKGIRSIVSFTARKEATSQ